MPEARLLKPSSQLTSAETADHVAAQEVVTRLTRMAPASKVSVLPALKRRITAEFAEDSKPTNKRAKHNSTDSASARQEPLPSVRMDCHKALQSSAQAAEDHGQDESVLDADIPATLPHNTGHTAEQHVVKEKFPSTSSLQHVHNHSLQLSSTNQV